MNKAELRTHCEQAVLKRVGRDLSGMGFEQRMLEEHQLVLELLKKADLQERALTVIRERNESLCVRDAEVDVILKLVTEVLEGKYEYLNYLESC